MTDPTPHPAPRAAPDRRAAAAAPGGDPDRGPSGAPDRPHEDFIRAIVREDMEAGRYDEVVTRFPPEPNGYLHIGHAKAIALSHGVAEAWGGRFHLRFDDTNPETEEATFTEAIQEDVRWLGFDWGEHLYFASDYFERFYELAEGLVRDGKAYVDSQDGEAIRAGRGSVTEPGVDSPYRNRTPEENLDLLRRMRAGEFPDGAHVLRAKIDMAHPNMLMRDPLIYRIRHAEHHRTGDAWCIYPLYDYAHCLEDAVEGVTHSFCTLEFENNRALYDWFLEATGFTEPRPHQYEFARGELDYTVTSKRKVARLIREGHVAGWDDPRLTTLAGLRRRGVPPGAIRAFWEMVGVTKANTRIDVGKLEYAIRDHLNAVAPRVMGVLRPLPVTVTTWEEGATEWLDAPLYPRDVPLEGSRRVPFTRRLLIDREDFSDDPPPGWTRLSPGAEVRLRYGYFVRCDEVVRDPDTGGVVELRCSHDPDTRGGDAPDGRRPAGTLHWVSATESLPAEFRLYDRLFTAPDPEDAPPGVPDEEAVVHHLNPDSLVVLEGRIEPSVADDPPDTRWQLERTGYFWRDPVDGRGDRLVLNRIVTLRDTWSGRKGRGDGAADRAAAEAERRRVEAQRAAAAAAGPRARVSDARAAAREADPELAARMARYREELGLSLDDADVLTGSREVSNLFEDALAVHGDAGAVASWVVNEVMRVAKERDPSELPFDGAALGRLVALVADGTVSRVSAKEVFAEMADSGGDPAAIVERRGLTKVSDEGALEPLVAGVLEAWPDEVEAYRGGKAGLLGFFVGEVMKRSGGSADPKAAKALLVDRLEAGGGS